MVCIKCGAELPEGSAYCNYCGKKQIVTAAKKGRKRSNGEGSVYRVGNTWMAEVTYGYKTVGGVQRRNRARKGGFRTKAEAIRYLEVMRNEKTVTRQAPTIQRLWEEWQEGPYKKLSKSKQCAYRIAFGKMEDIALARIDFLTVHDLQMVINEKAPTYYPARDIKTLLSHLYKRAMADQFVTQNLSDFVELPDLNATERTAFTEEEIGLFWEDYAAGNRFTGYILLMIYTGMMPGELLEAHKDNVNWQDRMIVGAGKKTGMRKQTPIVLADVIVPVLADLCQHSESDKLITISRDNFYARYHETTERVGCRDLPPYSCRHSTATALALDKIAPSVIQKVMRHARFSTTENYIHVDVSPMLEAVNEMANRRKNAADLSIEE